MAHTPQIQLLGARVIVTRGGDVTVHQLASHEDAIAKAVELEEGYAADKAARDALYDKYVDDGVDVVRKPEIPEPPAEPTPEPPPVPEPAVIEAPPVVEPHTPTPPAPAVDPEPVAEVPTAPVPTEPAEPLGLTAWSRWEPESSRIVVTMETNKPVTLHRQFGPAKKSSFEFKPGGAPRAYKGEVGWEFTLRLGSEDGPLVHSAIAGADQDEGQGVEGE